MHALLGEIGSIRHGRTWPGHPRLGLVEQRRIQVLPSWVLGSKQTDLPRARPALQAGLALDCRSDVLVMFEVNEAGEGIAANEAAADTVSMFPDAADQVIRDADTERSVGFVRHNVNPAAHRREGCAWEVKKTWMAGPGPAMTIKGRCDA